MHTIISNKPRRTYVTPNCLVVSIRPMALLDGSPMEVSSTSNQEPNRDYEYDLG